jgi:hypothetical protein
VADFLQMCSGWLDGLCGSQLAQTVDIRSGAAEQIGVTATIGLYEVVEDNGDGIVTIAKLRDYFIAVADYQLDGVIIEPETGHHIVETDGRIYEVVPAGGEPCARFSDVYKQMWRIHTKLIGVE